MTDLIASCAARVRAADPGGVPLFAGLCCTHYGYIADRFCSALGAALGRPVQALDPNARMVDDLTLDAPALSDSGQVSVHVFSKVTLDDTARHAIARLVAPISPATAQALLSYSHVPDLF